MPTTIEQRVAATAAATAQLPCPIPNGLCWAFVHHVLVAAGAKSFYEFNATSGEHIFAPWGEKADAPRKGYVVILKDAAWQYEVTVTVGRGSVKTKRTETRTGQLQKHVGVVVAVYKDGSVDLANQGVPKPDAAPTVTRVPLKRLSKGEVRYYKPVEMPAGKASSPTPAAKAAAADPKCK